MLGNWNMTLYICLTVTVRFIAIGYLVHHTQALLKSVKVGGMLDLSGFFLATHIAFTVLFTLSIFHFTYCAFISILLYM